MGNLFCRENEKEERNNSRDKPIIVDYSRRKRREQRNERTGGVEEIIRELLERNERRRYKNECRTGCRLGGERDENKK